MYTLVRRSYPEYPWCCIGVFVLAIAGGMYDSLRTTPFTIDPIMGALFGLGGIALIIALVDIHRRKEAQRIVKSTIESHGKGRIPVGDFAEEVEMTASGVRRAVTDLRTKELIEAHFDPKTGDISIGKELSVPAEAPPRAREANFCEYCGARLLPAARFCTNCGASLR